jgi:leucine dehydrogenase
MFTEAGLIDHEDFLDYALSYGFGDLHFKVDRKIGMKAIIAIHSTKLGPALGGCRFIEYANTAAAIKDAMRLAIGMSYKAALANLPLGGGKAVIIKPAKLFDRESFLHAFGQFINELSGRYITAIDSGTQISDMDIIAQQTPYVAGLSRNNGDPSPSTAKGIVEGIQAAVQFKLAKDKLDGLHIAIQGLGNVGYLLAKHLHELGVKLTVTDINSTLVKRAVREFKAIAIPANKIHQVSCDVFAPCALGATINDTTINQLQTSIIAGSANNQLADSHHGHLLHEKGILYAPDYVINTGGLIFAASKYFHTPEHIVDQQMHNIHSRLLEIFTLSQQENRPTSEIADSIAQGKLGLSAMPKDLLTF